MSALNVNGVLLGHLNTDYLTVFVLYTLSILLTEAFFYYMVDI